MENLITQKKIAVFLAAMLLIFTLFSSNSFAYASSNTNISDLSEITGSGNYTLTSNTTIDSTITISKGWNVNLDFNGKTVNIEALTGNSLFDYAGIYNLGTLTIGDSAPAGSGGIVSNGLYAILNEGALTITNGAYQCNTKGMTLSFSGSSSNYGAQIIRTLGALTIHDGKFTSKGGAINTRPGSNSIINSGQFYSTSSNSNNPFWVYCITNGGDMIVYDALVRGIQGAIAGFTGNLTIYDGDYKTDWSNSSSFYGLYIAGEVGAAKGSIYGGTFSSPKYAAFFGNDGDGGIMAETSVTVYGGTFVGKTGAISVAEVSAKNPRFLGGRFLKSPTDSLSNALVDSKVVEHIDTALYTQSAVTGEVQSKVVTALNIKKTSLTLVAGETSSLSVSFSPTNLVDSKVLWSSSDDDIVSVDSQGNLKAKKTGTATITASLLNGSASCSVSVIKKPAVSIPPLNTDTPTNTPVAGVSAPSTIAAIADNVSAIVSHILAGDTLPAGCISPSTQAAVENAIAGGKTISVKIFSEPLSSQQVPLEDQSEVSKSLGTNSNLVQFFDFSINLMADDSTLGTINQLSESVEFSVLLPENMVDTEKSFYMIRVHEGEATKLPITLNGAVGTFSTDRFSTYALVYDLSSASPQDTDSLGLKSSVPDTGDGFNPVAILLLVLLASAGLSLTRKKLI